MLERSLNILSHVAPEPFQYDVNTRLFDVGMQSVPLTGILCRSVCPKDELDRSEVEKRLRESALLLGSFDRPYQTPRFMNWILDIQQDTKRSRDIEKMIIETMIDAYVQINKVPKRQLPKGDLWGFTYAYQRPGHPLLTVPGSCACFGVTPHGLMLKEWAWKDDLAEWEMHNVDTEVQEVALLAGAGALSKLCLTETG